MKKKNSRSGQDWYLYTSVVSRHRHCKHRAYVICMIRKQNHGDGGVTILHEVNQLRKGYAEGCSAVQPAMHVELLKVHQVSRSEITNCVVCIKCGRRLWCAPICMEEGKKKSHPTTCHLINIVFKRTPTAWTSMWLTVDRFCAHSSRPSATSPLDNCVSGHKPIQIKIMASSPQIQLIYTAGEKIRQGQWFCHSIGVAVVCHSTQIHLQPPILGELENSRTLRGRALRSVRGGGGGFRRDGRAIKPRVCSVSWILKKHSPMQILRQRIRPQKHAQHADFSPHSLCHRSFRGSSGCCVSRLVVPPTNRKTPTLILKGHNRRWNITTPLNDWHPTAAPKTAGTITAKALPSGITTITIPSGTAVTPAQPSVSILSGWY